MDNPSEPWLINSENSNIVGSIKLNICVTDEKGSVNFGRKAIFNREPISNLNKKFYIKVAIDEA